MLRMALELAEDVAAVYMSSSDQIKRGYNQAFFNKLYITPQWDDDPGQTAIRVSRAEMTTPYAILLDKHLPNKVMNEVELIRQASTTAGSGPNEPLPDAGCSIFVKLAEGEGFEPSSEEAPKAAFKADSFWLCRATNRLLAPVLAPVLAKIYLRFAAQARDLDQRRRRGI